MFVPYTANSLLYGIPHDDPHSHRRLMDGLLRRFAGVSKNHPSQLHSLDQVEFNIVNRIVEEAADNILVRNAAIRFAAAHTGSDVDLYHFAREFNAVVVPGILGPVQNRDAAAFEQAKAIYENIAENGPAPMDPYPARVYHRGYDIDDDRTVLPTDDEPKRESSEGEKEDSEGEKKNSEREKESPDVEKQVKKYTIKFRVPLTGPASAKSKGVTKSKATGKGKRATTSTRKNANGKPPKNQPKKPRDFTTINEGQDRNVRAVLGQPDENLFILKFNCEREVKPGVFMRGPGFTYNYHHIRADKFDWHNSEDISHLNGWRQQIFARQFGSIRQTRYQYTVREQDTLYNILKEHLETPEVGGRFKLINWQTVTDKLNDHFRGYQFKAGEAVAQTRYPKGNVGWVSSDTKKKIPHHTYIEREASGVHNQMAHFTDEKCRELIATAKKVDEDYYLALADAGGAKSSKTEGKKRARENDDNEEEFTPTKKLKSTKQAEEEGGENTHFEMDIVTPGTSTSKAEGKKRTREEENDHEELTPSKKLKVIENIDEEETEDADFQKAVAMSRESSKKKKNNGESSKQG